MKNIFITGSSGFIGKNVIKYFNSKFYFLKYAKNDVVNINEEVVLHFAGKAHDLKKTINPREYYAVNTDLTKKVFDVFLDSKAKVFITISSVKAVADNLNCELTEDFNPNPTTHYGKSKLFAEQYILSKEIPQGKRVYILRPCIVHGPENIGNLNSLFEVVRMGVPWPLRAFENLRSLCYIDNLCFIIDELIENDKISSGVYNIADDNPISTNNIIKIISHVLNTRVRFVNLPRFVIIFISLIGNHLKLPLNSERLKKLTENYIISNKKIKTAIKKELPYSVEEGLYKTFQSLYLSRNKNL